MRPAGVLLGASVAVALACDRDVICLAVTVPGIAMTIVDEEGADRSATAEVTLVRLAPAPYDSASGPIAGPVESPLLIAYSAPGRYRVRVTLPGYESFEREVVVPYRTDGCLTPVTRHIDVRLSPAAASLSTTQFPHDL